MVNISDIVAYIFVLSIGVVLITIPYFLYKTNKLLDIISKKLKKGK